MTISFLWWLYQGCEGKWAKFSRQNSPTVQFDTTTPASRKTSLKNQIDSASFPTISRLSQVAQFLKRREFMLELKRWGRAQIQTEMVEFTALPFPSSKKTSNVVISRRSRTGTVKKMYKQSWCTWRVVVLLTKPIAFWGCRCRRSFVRSLMAASQRRVLGRVTMNSIWQTIIP